MTRHADNPDARRRRPWEGLTQGGAPRLSATTAASVLVGTAIVCLTLLILEAGADLLPDGTLFWLITWERLCVLVGLLALVPFLHSWRDLRTPLDLPILVLLGGSLLTTILTGADMPLWRWLLTGVGLYYLTVALRRCWPASWFAVTTAVTLATAAATFTALKQWNEQAPTGFCRASLDGTVSGCLQEGAWIRVIGTFANPNLLAAFLVMALPILVAHLVRSHDFGQRVVMGVLVVGASSAAFLTFSRGGTMALVAGLVVTWALLRPNRFRLTVLAAGTALAAVLGLVLLLTGNLVGVRSTIWQQAVVVTVTKPWGAGLGLGGPAIDSRIDYRESIQHAHNLLLTWGADIGWLGVVAILWLGIAALLVGFRHALAGRVVAPYAVGSLVALVAVSQLDAPTQAVRVAFMAWLVLGLVVTADEGDGLVAADTKDGATAAHD